MIKVSFLVLMLLITALLGSGCATKRTAGWDRDGKGSTMEAGEFNTAWAKASKHWEKRDVKEELKAALQIYETLAQAKPDEYKVLAKLCRGYYLLADGHEENMDEKKRLWELGITWGEKGMATNPKFKDKVVKEEGKVEAALDVLTKNEVEVIYWTAANLGKWAKNSGIATMLKYKSRIKEMINRVGELDRTFFYGAFDRYWGVYYAVAPGFAGGDIKKSFESFQKSFTAEKNYLGTHVLYAEVYATKKGDKNLFKEKLEYVLKAKNDSIKDITPENIIEQRKAKKLLANMDEHF